MTHLVSQYVPKGFRVEIWAWASGKHQLIVTNGLEVFCRWIYPTEQQAQLAFAGWYARNFDGAPCDGWTFFIDADGNKRIRPDGHPMSETVCDYGNSRMAF